MNLTLTEIDFQIGFWHPFGPHGGETAKQILERKSCEIAKNGWTLWSFQKSLTLEAWHKQICDASAKTVFVFCSEGKGAMDPKGKVQPCKHYHFVGDSDWKPLPENIQIPHPIGRKNEASAFIVKQIHHPVNVGEQVAVEYFSKTGGPHWRADKVPTRGEFLIRPGGTILMRRYRAVLELKEPYLATVGTDDIITLSKGPSVERVNGHYSDTEPAQIDSKIYVSDIRQLLSFAHKILANFDANGTERESDCDEEFKGFVHQLYTSGMVMTDFNGPLFDQGPSQFIADRTIAPLIARKANLLTLRMFLHTLARGHRATWVGHGYPYFADAYKSGGLKEIFDRLQWFCDVTDANNSEVLYDGAKVEEDE